MRKLVAISCALVCTLAIFYTPALALTNQIESSGSSGTIPVELTIEQPRLDVIIPMSLPASVSSIGIVTVATTVEIINKSHGPIVVSNVTVQPAEGWAFVDYNSDLSRLPINTKKLSFEINGCKTKEDGTLDFDRAKWPEIGPGSVTPATLPISYALKVVMQSAAISKTTVGSVVFTVGWAV